MSLAVLGLDVGGANLKAALHSSTGPQARSVPFALWREPARLRQEIKNLIGDRSYQPFDRLAVTMTGELCDCFPSKCDGVLAILDAVGAAASVPVRIWTLNGRFLPLAEARRQPLDAAAANWLALATLAARYAESRPTALLIDVGSTTTDLIPLVNGRPAPTGRTDPDRLRSGELVYTGVRRTPVCALLGEGVAAEVFATTLDAYLVLGSVGEDPLDTNTADGKPATRAAAELRLARMRCADLESSTPAERRWLAWSALSRQVEIIHAALARVIARLPAPPATVILAGEGEFLAREVVRAHGALAECRIVSLTERLGQSVSQAACAHAVAVLAAEAEG
jgi:probable H4MPT-linked C1 transfer pathway protein